MMYKIKFTVAPFSIKAISTLASALDCFIEIERDLVMGELRAHTSKRSAVNQELVDRFDTVFSMLDFSDFVNRYLAGVERGSLNLNSMFVDGEKLLAVLRSQRDIHMDMLPDTIASENAEDVEIAASSLVHLTSLIGAVSDWVEQAKLPQETAS